MIYTLNMQNVHLSPPQLAPLFGVNVSTIKRWVDKGYLESETTPGGHRRVSREQLQQFIKKYPRHAKSSYVLNRLRKKDFCPDDDCWKKYYQHLLKNENQPAAELIEKQYLSGASVLKILSSIITPTMRHLSDQWSENKITVYDEHRISFNIRLHLQKLNLLIPDKTKKDSPRAILACAPGEYHELPLQLLALIFKQHGWQTQVLGVNIKIGELIRAVKKIKPYGIIISKTYSRKKSDAYFDQLTRFADREKICLAFGGGAWRENLKKSGWAKRQCVRFFPSLDQFSDFLKNYRRK